MESRIVQYARSIAFEAHQRSEPQKYSLRPFKDHLRGVALMADLYYPDLEILQAGAYLHHADDTTMNIVNIVGLFNNPTSGELGEILGVYETLSTYSWEQKKKFRVRATANTLSANALRLVLMDMFVSMKHFQLCRAMVREASGSEEAMWSCFRGQTKEAQGAYFWNKFNAVLTNINTVQATIQSHTPNDRFGMHKSDLELLHVVKDAMQALFPSHQHITLPEEASLNSVPNSDSLLANAA